MDIKRATVQITKNIALQGWEVDKEYRLSASDIGKAINKRPDSASDFAASKQGKVLLGNNSTPRMVSSPEGGYLNLYVLEVANCYWEHWLKQGNPEAIALVCALARVDLVRLFDQEFNKVKSKEGYVQFSEHAYNEILRTTRDHTIWTHPGFVLANKLNKFPGAQVHDLITVLCGGKTAKLARLDPQPLEGDMHTGLNHYQDAKLLETIARAKLKFTSMKYGSWQNRVTRSCIAALAEMGIQPSVKA